MRVLGIETSCDETAAAVVDDNYSVASSVVESSIDQHRAFGGVVPELAGRAHLATLGPVVAEALARAGGSERAPGVDGVAVTAGPGLVGSLLVGLSAAKAYAMAWGVPYVGVNHLEAHLVAPLLEDPGLAWPLLTLLVSGGHSVIVLQRAPGDYDVLGATVDDAAGEAYDKVARWLGLGYPGGPEIDRLSLEGDASALPLPASMVGPGLDLSFSGVKTAVVRATERDPALRTADVAAAFQDAVAEQLMRKLTAALDAHPVAGLALAGGVAANRELRARVTDLAASRGLGCHLPAPAMCTDNAAMVAAAGLHRLSAPSGLDLPARPGWGLGEP
ncbi:MAG TPA: tRNA (adenosine(37)-N6)-threonylcarbamoyltransferase complex transferase subunit TsaD [Acidimicrobiales bacterium]|nr:tRNA (adenosine(37)-N6)-threonylcarbamoyltransferase complex transferase subunit TsaD [Acidimicrobiales bacterium]